ncbi:MAG TPA: class I SAM-dependent methyltransferase [Candidatus Aquilonibacter sp.]|nr:class I SAM-dependent methyltransferase [Candidatus Aquilonibacter sp.]
MTADVLKWDVGNWSAALPYWERHGRLADGPLDCLEIGANQGGLSAWLATHGHHVLCSDLERCEAGARPLIERHGLLENVRFADIDATEIPYENRFDVIIFKSVLGGVGHNGEIERQRKAVASMYRALRPGGRLLFAENLSGSGLHKFFRSTFVRWGNAWRYVTVDEMLDFLRDFSDVKYATTGVLGTFGRNERQRQMLASVDRKVLNTVTPPTWRYIMYGVATK